MFLNIRQLLRGVAIAALCAVTTAYAAEAPIVVLYPDIDQPYSKVFEEILQGIRQTTERPIRAYAIRAGQIPEQTKQQVDTDHAEAIIALGRRGIEAGQALAWTGPLAVGAVVADSSLKDGTVAGITLDPSPSKLFTSLKRIAPQVTTIHVVSDPTRSGWVVSMAKTAAIDAGLALVVHNVGSASEALRTYGDIMATARSPKDAIWLPLDATTVDQGTILPLILRGSWDRHLAVFSSAPGHAQRGFLFSVQPDHRAVGVALARLAEMQIRNPTTGYGIAPLPSMKVVVNVRTAQHLGIRVPPAAYDIEVK